MRKKILFVLLTVTMVCSLAVGCKNNSKQKASGQQVKTETNEDEVKTNDSDLKYEKSDGSDFEFVEVEGGISISSYTGNGRLVEIPKTINGQTVVEIGEYAFGANQNLESVKIPDTVTCIDGGAFVTSSLKSIKIPGSVKLLGRGVFENCINLESVTLENGIEEIGQQCFQMCNLKEIIIPDSVKIIRSDAFSYNKNLKKVTLGNGVQTIEHAAFQICDIDEITIPESVVDLSGAIFDSERNGKRIHFYVKEGSKAQEYINENYSINQCSVY